MKLLLLTMGFCVSIGVQAQNVGIGTSSPNSNAKLDITATDKGLLIPRMDSTHRKAIPPTTGLLIYDSTTNSFWYNNGVAWQNMATASSGWSLTGNAGIDTSKNFLGTTDNNPLILRVNNQFAGKLGNGAVVIGEGAYSNSQNPNNLVLTAIGLGALANNFHDPAVYTSGYNNTAVGGYVLTANTTGQDNTSVGAFSMNSSTTALGNSAVGSGAMQHNVTGNNNSVLGAGSLYGNISGSGNTAIGLNTLATNNANYNTAVGGMAAANSNTVGNTAIGYKAMFNNFLGANNTAIGYNSDVSVNNTEIDNATAVGANAKVDASNKIRLGDANVTVVESNGVFNTVSDGRFKYNVQENVKGLDFIMRLRPVTYQFDAKKQDDFTKGLLTKNALNSPSMPVAYNESNAIKRTGFIAQEVAAAAQKTGYDFDGVKIPANDNQYYSLSYASFVVPLVKSVQEQQQTIESLRKLNNLLQKQNELMQAQNESIMKRLQALEKKMN